MAAAGNTHDASRPMSAETTSFPTFLDTDPFPSSSREGRPTSSASAATDATSEFGGNAEDFASAKERQSNLTATTGQVGEVGLPPSRPTSMGTSVDSSQRGRLSAQAPPGSRRGLAAFAARSGGSLRNSGEGGDGRPESSMSKTHVPSLTAQGFFRPMSSQKLQAQRGQRPTSSLAQNVVNERRSEDSMQRHRYSNASVNTLRDGLPPTRDEDVPPMPTSRGTMFTSDGLLPGGQTAASVVSNNSTAPLQQTRHTPDDLKLETNGQRKSNTSSQPAPKSPRSFRASLGLGSRNQSRHEAQERRVSPAHEKLHSDPSSPNDDHAAEKPQIPHPAAIHPPAPKGQGKNYEYFAGNMLFFLSGRLLNTRARPLNIATFILTTLPAALFFAFSAPYLWRHVSPAIPIIFAYVYYITISAFLHAAFSDPGILPRNLHPHPPPTAEEERDLLAVGPPTTEWVMVKTFPSLRTPKQQAAPEEAQQSGGSTTAMEVPTKYCKSCAIWRPPRAHHCRVCDACIETQDHHCVWLNNCVGRRNYRFFFAYVGFGTLLALMLLAFSITHVSVYGSRHGIGFGGALSGRTQERVAFAMFLYSVLALPYPGSLFVYHLFLIARGETTREYLNSHKFLPKDRHRPFTQANWRRNWMSVLTRPRPPTYMQFKRRYREGDVRFGYTAPKKARKAGMKGRYSVGGNGVANGNGKAEPEKQQQGMEMKQLPPQPPPKDASPPGGIGGFKAKLQAKGAGRGLGGIGNNSTPR